MTEVAEASAKMEADISSSTEKFTAFQNVFPGNFRRIFRPVFNSIFEARVTPTY